MRRQCPRLFVAISRRDYTIFQQIAPGNPYFSTSFDMWFEAQVKEAAQAWPAALGHEVHAYPTAFLAYCSATGSAPAAADFNAFLANLAVQDGA